MKPRSAFGLCLIVNLNLVIAYAQSVGIGIATPHPSARLHIHATDQGILIPNVSLTATADPTPVTGPAVSLLVYNTATINDVTPGFYYWDGTKWVRLLTNTLVSDAWLLLGNAGTDPLINFIGTIDNKSFRIRVNNHQTLQLNTNFSIQRDAGGNPRGVEAIDLQRTRYSMNSVASGDYSTIGGGLDNSAIAPYANVDGGASNWGGGRYSTIGGGYGNSISGDYSTISGGHANNAIGNYTTIGGGFNNSAHNSYSVICGGMRNSTQSDFAIVVGGNLNIATGEYSIVNGGITNFANGQYSVILGGSGNTADGNYNLVFGRAILPSVTEDYRVYLFSSGFPGFLVLNRSDGDHPIHVGTNATNGNGAHLTAAGVWTSPSSHTLKDRLKPLDPQEVLQKIVAMPVEGWYYKSTEEYHIGPYAEDFYAAFGTGVLNSPGVGKYLAASDVAGVSLLGIQALHKENDSLRRRVSYLETENAALRARLDRLESLVEKIPSTQANP